MTYETIGYHGTVSPQGTEPAMVSDLDSTTLLVISP